MSVRITIINGPNLNLLGKREPHIYGHQSFEEFFKNLKQRFPNFLLTYRQSNVEGELVQYIQEASDQDGILLNAAAYTHTSVAIADAIVAVEVPVVEVHISNILAREEIRKHSLLSAYCVGSISGLGLEGYSLGLHYFETREPR